MQTNQALTLLGGLTASEFLANYWQKKPLLIRQAIPNFSGLLDPNTLAGLACEDEVESRIVVQEGEMWQLKHGPFTDADFAKLSKKSSKKKWTLLVQSVNHFLPEATELLQQFNFIPYARLDDLMVSYAPDGGGVGPHFDSYDVFLLQGQGKRLWRISAQTELTLVENAPLRILKNFNTEEEWVLDAGDMLYLPPQIAHWGIAQSMDGEDCMTYSIGFRAPKHQELASEFLGFLQDRMMQDTTQISGIYQDADLCLQENPAEISAQMIEKASDCLQKITWSKQTIAEFIGCYLTEPKPTVFYTPNKKISFNQFLEKILSLGFCLDHKSQLLFTEEIIFMNGEQSVKAEKEFALIQLFAHHRQLHKNELDPKKFHQHLYFETIKLFHLWYLAGYCHIGHSN